MRLGPFELAIRRPPATKAAVARMDFERVPGDGGWKRILEPFAGAWQRNIEWSAESVLSFHAVFACVTLIAADIGKLRFKLQQLTDKGIWVDTTSASFSPVLQKPNRYQTHIQFKENWMTSKLTHGNTYVLKQRDDRGVVTGLYVLDPRRVTPKVSDVTGEVYYTLGPDNLSNVRPDDNGVTVPASEIIHDRFNCLFHPLVGLSPIFACGLAAAQGIEIIKNQAGFFKNSSMPGGVLIAPKGISDDNAKQIKAAWEAGYTGANAGRVAVLGDGMTFTPMRMNAVDSQLVEQLNMTEKIVCSTFHVPAFMVGIGAEPTFSNSETRTGHYYSQCLQSHIEAMEILLDEALGLPRLNYGVTLDLEALLRMDMGAQITALGSAVDKAIMTNNEARKKLNLPPLVGGDTVYMQQQDFAIEDLAKRSQQGNPFDTGSDAATTPEPADEPPADPAVAEEDANKLMTEVLMKAARDIREALHV